MSNPNLPLGIALVCGAAACALTCSVAELSAGVGVPVGAVVAAAALFAQGGVQKPKEEREPESKKPKPDKKKTKKASAPSSTPAPSQAPSTPEPEKKKPKKKSKKAEKPETKAEVAPKPSPAPQSAKKAAPPQKTPSVENDEPKELTKTQLQKLKKKQKKESEEKAKVEEKALEAKREAAQAKKAAKAAQKKKEPSVTPQAHVQVSEETQDVKEEPLEDGWEKPKPRNTIKRIRTPQETKKIQASKAKAASAEEPKVSSEVKVPKNKHGSIIGPKGAFLDKIKEHTGATITMPKREGGGLGVVITGTAAQVKEAEQIIRDIALRGFSTVTHPEHAANEINLEDPQLIGRIAGKGGAFLRAIQEKSGASLQLPDKNSKKTSITISGKPLEITNAKIAIMDLINQGYSQYTHPGWTTEEYDFQSEFLGRLIGAQGATIKDISQQFDVKIDTPKRDDLKQDIITIKGKPGNIERAKEEIAKLLVVQEAPEEVVVADPNWEQDPQEPEW